MNFGCKSDKETMSAESEWRKYHYPTVHVRCGQQLISGGCNANFVEGILDNIVNPSPPPKTADPAYFVLFTTHGVCYICLSTLDCFAYRTNFVSTRRGISRRRRIVDKLQLNWFFRDNVKTWFIVLVWPVCGRGVY